QGIALRHDLTVSALKDANQLQSNSLRAGQMLSIPVGTYSPEPQPSQKFPARPASAVARQTRSYRVKPGDTLWTIAQKHKVSVSQLQQWNKGAGKALKPGQVLTVQGRAAAVASSPKKAATRKAVTYYQVRKG